MSKVLVDDSSLSGIGSAIRSKNGSNTVYKPSEMAAAINAIDVGITPTGTVNISQNGTVDVTQYASANVNVPNSYVAGDEGKVVSNGTLVVQTARASDITENGTYDTTLNDEVVVNVEGAGGVSLGYFLEDFDATWTDRSNDPPYSYAFIMPNKRAAVFEAQSLSILSTDNPIDFSNYTKLRIDVALSGNIKQDIYNNTLSRLSVSNNIINNSNRGNNYVTFSTKNGSFELLLPENRNALYVGILCWSWCDLVVVGVTAE